MSPEPLSSKPSKHADRTRQAVGWIFGPLCLALTFVLSPPEGLTAAGWHAAGVASLMAVWWITEAIPIPATSLLPLVLFPLLGIVDIRGAAAPYANPIIYLFLGGFLIALAMERWNLHRRIALGIIGFMGTRPTRIIAGFLLASALLSMWVSNTATALMMLPIAISVIQLVKAEADTDKSKNTANTFSTVLLLCVAYGCTIGGLGTLIGTPPNALLAAYLSETYGFHIGFGQWMLVGVPVVIIGLPLAYFLMTRVIYHVSTEEMPGAAESIERERAKLGRISGPELAVACVFSLTALGWIFQPWLASVFPMISDTGIAILGGVLLFMIPVDWKEGIFLMDWQTAKGVPWDVFLLFGGGLSLAAALESHGVAAYLGSLFTMAESWPTLLMVLGICLGILALTELTSNTATAATFLPIVASIALVIGENPLLLLVPAALAASCSFMLPVGTPPNAIVFGSGMVSLPQMVRAGVLLNIAFLLIIVGVTYVLGPLVFGITLGVTPDWVGQR